MFVSFIETIGFPSAEALGKSEAPLQVVSAAVIKQPRSTACARASRTGWLWCTRPPWMCSPG